MQTNISERFRNTPQGDTAEEILRKCVHCGFCTATCPTYQLLGDELDGPRGRIYQIKQVLEGAEATDEIRLHLDRCLTCRSCETTCPSGVEYGKLLDIGRGVVEESTRRPVLDRLQRALLANVLSGPRRAAALFSLARLVRPVLPGALAAKIAPRQKSLPGVSNTHDRYVLMPGGCVQRALTPRTNQAAAILLDRLGVGVREVADGGCCGALAHHLSYEERALEQVRRNVDAWFPHIENGAEAIIITATGCGVMVKDYGHLLRTDERYAERARRVAEAACDLSEFLEKSQQGLHISPRSGRIAFQAPCSYQHGLRLAGTIERILEGIGYRMTAVADAHLCCGSAGTYSVLQPELSGRLLENKLTHLMADSPDFIVTANVGCQTHIATKATRPVIHWAELLAEDLEK